MTTLKELTTHLVHLLCEVKPDSMSGGICNFRGISLDFTYIDEDIQLEKVGYKKGGNKMSLLKRYYFDQESFDYAKKFIASARLESKKRLRSVGISLRGRRKTFTHHDFCLQSLVLSHDEKTGNRIDVFHRSAEAIKTFSADLIFLRDILKEVGFTDYSVIRFNFANLTISPRFFALLVAHMGDSWLMYLKLIKKKNPEFHHHLVRWGYRMINTIRVDSLSANMQIKKRLPELIGKNFDDYNNYLKEEYQE